MARVILTLSLDRRPAFYDLLAVAQSIAETHGEEVAADWAGGVVGADFDLFFKVMSDRRPELKLIAGGRP